MRRSPAALSVERSRRGLALPHIINSGRSVGDARVNVFDLAQALRLAAKQQAGVAADERGVLVVALDSAPADYAAAAEALRDAVSQASTTSGRC